MVLAGDESLIKTEHRLEQWGFWQNNLGGAFPRRSGGGGGKTIYNLSDPAWMIEEVERLVLRLVQSDRRLWADLLKLTYIQQWNHSQIALRLKVDRKFVGAQLAFAVVWVDGQLNPVLEKRFASGA